MSFFNYKITSTNNTVNTVLFNNKAFTLRHGKNIIDPNMLSNFHRILIASAPFQGTSPCIYHQDGKSISPVQYWTNIYKSSKIILGYNDITAKTKVDKSDYHNIMSNIVSMEIVPFRSYSEIGARNKNDKVYDKCWNEYTKHILYHAGAKVVILIGKAFDTFIRNNSLVSFDLSSKGYCFITFGGKDRMILHPTTGQGNRIQFESLKTLCECCDVKYYLSRNLSFSKLKNPQKRRCRSFRRWGQY